MTNGDKIRSMTDEELARWLCMMSHPLMIGYLYCPYCGTKMEGGHNP